jgi:hypothetical protein
MARQVYWGYLSIFSIACFIALIDNVLFPIDFLGSYHPVRSVEWD